MWLHCVFNVMNWDSWSYIHQEFLKRTIEKGCSHLLFLHYFIYSLFVHRLQNVISLSYFWLFQTSTCMEIHTLQSKHFITFFNRKLPSSYANYPNQVDKCKCEQQGRILWNSFIFRLSYSSSSLLVCGPLEFLVVFVLFPLFSVSCYLSFSLLFYLCYCQSVWQ